MKYVFLGAFIVLGLLSGVAWMWQPQTGDSRTELVWCSDDCPARREQIDLFNKLHPEYHVRLDPMNATMEKVIVQSLGGVGPDLFDCYSGFMLAGYVRAGIALDCTDYLVQRGFKAEETWPCAQPTFEYDGRLYGWPENVSAPGIWYNKDLFDAAGEPYPKPGWTWDDFIATAKRLTRRDNQGRPITLGFLGFWDWQSVLGQWGGRIYNAEGTRSALDSSEAGEALQFMQDLIYKHRIMPTPTEELAMAGAGGWAGGEIISLFGAGKGAMAIGGRYWLTVLRNDAYTTTRFGAIELPRGPSPRTFGVGKATLVNANSRHKEAALLFLDYLHSREWGELVNHQADGLAAMKDVCYSPSYLHDPEYPSETDNEVWRQAVENAMPPELSPYVSGQTVDRILLVQTDLVKNNIKTGAEAARDSARKINEAIVEQLKLDPDMKARYMEAIRHGARPAWDDPADAP